MADPKTDHYDLALIDPSVDARPDGVERLNATLNAITGLIHVLQGALNATKDEIMGGAPGAFDDFTKIRAELEADNTAFASLLNVVAGKFDKAGGEITGEVNVRSSVIAEFFTAISSNPGVELKSNIEGGRAYLDLTSGNRIPLGRDQDWRITPIPDDDGDTLEFSYGGDAGTGVGIKLSVKADGSIISSKYGPLENFFAKKGARSTWECSHEVLFAASADRLLSPLTSTITTQHDLSDVEIRMMINYEGHHDSVFVLKRDGDEIAKPQPFGTPLDASWAGNRNLGFAPLAYDHNHSTTMSTASLLLTDRGVSAGEHTYTLHVVGASAQVFALNRTIVDTDASGSERAISHVVLEEKPR